MRTLHDMDGWVYKKKNITAVMEIIKERFVPCCVMSCCVVLCCVVSCHIVGVLQGPDAKPRDHRASLLRDFLT